MQNPAAYIYYYVKDNVKRDAAFVDGIIGKVMDQTLVRKVRSYKCKLESKTKVLTTPQDEANEKLAVIDAQTQMG